MENTLKNHHEVEEAILHLLQALGEDVVSDALLDTPRRVASFYHEFLNPPKFNFTVFDNDGSDQMIVQDNIEFYSLCQHHLLPFQGVATVAYIPDKKIVGISKLARCVDFYSHGLQNQERITKQVADAIQDALDPVGVGVVLKARHSCMELRGVKKRNAWTTTSCLYGTFRDEMSCRNEFLALARGINGRS